MCEPSWGSWHGPWQPGIVVKDENTRDPTQKFGREKTNGLCEDRKGDMNLGGGGCSASRRGGAGRGGRSGALASLRRLGKAGGNEKVEQWYAEGCKGCLQQLCCEEAFWVYIGGPMT